MGLYKGLYRAVLQGLLRGILRVETIADIYKAAKDPKIRGPDFLT